MSDTTLKFCSNLAVSSSKKVRIYSQIFSQKNYIAFERYIAQKEKHCSFLNVFNIVTFKVDKKVFIPCALRGQYNFEGQRNRFLK
jgi:hypothetical protein